MAGNKLFEEQLRIMTPHTYNALTKLIMAMAGVSKNAGKKTFFGRDKGQEAYEKFLNSLKATLQCMVLDEVIRESSTTEEVILELEGKIQKFKMAFPNWQDAYSVSDMFFESKEDAIATIKRLRQKK